MSGSAKSAGGDVASSAKSAAGDAKGAAQSAGRQIDQATPDLSANPFDDLLGKVRPRTLTMAPIISHMAQSQACISAEIMTSGASRDLYIESG